MYDSSEAPQNCGYKKPDDLVASGFSCSRSDMVGRRFRTYDQLVKSQLLYQLS